MKYITSVFIFSESLKLHLFFFIIYFHNICLSRKDIVPERERERGQCTVYYAGL